MTSVPSAARAAGIDAVDAVDAADVGCAHCGLPVPSGLVDAEADRQFCCGGCRMVYETIHRCGLDQYYALRQEADPATPVRATGRGYETFDDPTFQTRSVSGDVGATRRVTLYLDGVHCPACLWLVERIPHVLPGVLESRLDFGRHVVRLVWDDGRVPLSRIAGLLDTLGYPPHPCAPEAVDAARRAEDRRQLVRVGVAGACAGNVMLIAFALYGGMLHGIDPVFRNFLRAVSLVLTLVALLGPGRVFFVGAWSAFRTRVMHMDLPVAIALTAGTAWGALNTLRGVGEVYFESLTIVVFLLLVGRWIQHRQQRTAHDAIELLYTITPATARRVDPDGTVHEVAVESLATGTLVELRAGDTVPADGVVVAGRSDVDCSALTGESRPVATTAGDRVHAGTVNLGSRLVLRVEATGATTRLGRLLHMIEELARERAPIVRFADAVAHRFVAIVLVLAVVTVLLWLWRDPSRAVENAIALLIVTCPCALGLATPLAVVASVGRAARAGILVKGGEVLERLARPGRVLLDKTGTLTEGRTTLVHWTGDDAVRSRVAALEAGVAHPIARAFIDAAGPTPAGTGPVEVVQTLGRGLAGRVDGQTLVVGAPEFVRERTGGWPAWAEHAMSAALEEALTPIAVAADGVVVAVAGLGDPVRDDAAAAVHALATLGWETQILSGDHPTVVEAVGRRVGLDADRCEGGATPERKVQVVRAAMAAGETVVMVGDGVNDAGALAIASVGVAVHGGAEASLQAADVYLTRPELETVVELLRGSRRAAGVIRRNLVASLVYNLVTAGLAIGGVMNPLVAALLMPLSSLTVVTLSYRSRTFEARDRCP